MENKLSAVILIGHGGVPIDCPGELISNLKKMEGRRRALSLPPTKEELELDRTIRLWPRTPNTDPYKVGLETLANHLRKSLEDISVVTAYNEFCAPSLSEATESLVMEGTKVITIISSMLTPGGSHSEIEIPEEVVLLKEKYPNISINYAWPFDLGKVAKLLEEHFRCFNQTVLENQNF